MQRVIVFGSLNMDLTIACDRIPHAGETISGRGFLANPGGKGANQAVAAAKLGASTCMIGAVGRDVFGDQLIAALTESGVDCGHVARLDKSSTGVACIVRVKHDNRIILDAGANEVLRVEDISRCLDRLAVRGDIFLTQLECSLSATMAAISDAHRRDMYVALNPAPACALPDELWSCVDLVCLNEIECATITGISPDTEQSALKAMRWLADRGVRTAVITLGERGAVLLDEGRTGVSNPFEVNAIDTTCAGDTYLGAFVAGRAAGLPLDQIVRWASGASALTTTKIGAQQSIPDIEEVQRLLST